MMSEKNRAGEAMIRVSGLSKEYRLYDSKQQRLWDTLFPSRKRKPRIHSALRNIDLEVCRGETVGVIGVNGSGKSTLLKILTGVVTPTSGEVEVRGRVSALLELGAGFNTEYTGIENIYLNGTMMNIPREEMDKLLPGIVEFADIGEFIHQPVKNYSSGMFARLAFSVAISVKPDILIVDEALSVGDIFFQTKCYKKFDEFRAAGMTILFVSHDLSSISKYCSRTILLNKGELVAEGQPKEIVDLYKRMLAKQMNTDALAEESRDCRKGDGTGKTGNTWIWREAMVCNPDRLEYGDKLAEIVDFGIFDQMDYPTNTIPVGEPCIIRMKVCFHADILEPIFAFTIKNKLGIELTGTNTMFENCSTGLCKTGETCVVSFTQRIHLRGGEYLLSLGVTGFGSDDLKVYHRLYDICNFLVVCSKDTVGYFDPESTVTIKKEENRTR